jgi:hypothetical protein
MRSPRLLRGLLALGLVGCEQDLLADQPDAAPDAAPLPAGDFSCQEAAWPTAAPDPLAVRGVILDQSGTLLANVPIEVRDRTTDAVLAQGMTGVGATFAGKYNISTPTGGVARPFYRKLFPMNGYPVHSVVDPIAEFRTDVMYGYYLQAPGSAPFYAQLARTTADPAKGNLLITLSDCDLANANPVAGVTVEAPPGASVVYVDPDGKANASLTATTSKGEILIVNVEPGEVDVVIHAGPLTYRSWPVPIHAGEWTYSQRKP